MENPNNAVAKNGLPGERGLLFVCGETGAVAGRKVDKICFVLFKLSEKVLCTFVAYGFPGHSRGPFARNGCHKGRGSCQRQRKRYRWVLLIEFLFLYFLLKKFGSFPCFGGFYPVIQGFIIAAQFEKYISIVFKHFGTGVFYRWLALFQSRARLPGNIPADKGPRHRCLQMKHYPDLSRLPFLP